MHSQLTTDRATAINDLGTYGYCLIAEALPTEHVAELRGRLAEIAEREIADGTDYVYDEGSNQRVFSLLNKGRCFVELAQHPLALFYAEYVLGEEFLLSNIDANISGPGGKRMFLHNDQVFMPPPWNEPMVLNVAWMLDDFTAENGATRVIPGSHHCRDLDGVPSEDDAIPVCAPAGSAMVFEGRLWHQTGSNVTRDQRRFGLFTYYGKPYLRQQENFFLSVQPEVVASATPLLRRLLGYEPYRSLGSIDGLSRTGPRA